jgi:protein-disulfide isomerase
MFENGAPLDRPKLEHLAHDVGLDPKKFDADLDSEAVADRVARDRKLGDSLELTGTPTLYVDGRRFETGGDFEQDLKDWIELELELKTGSGAHPTPAASAPPPASAAPAGKKD